MPAGRPRTRAVQGAPYRRSGSLILVLDPTDVGAAGIRKIAVVNPIPGGGTSEPKEFPVT
jgi:hypothetical protein